MNRSVAPYIRLDRLLLVPYLVFRFLFRLLGSNTEADAETGPWVFIKLYGMGSVIRLAYALEQHGIPKEKVTLVTFRQMEPVTQLLGIPAIFIDAPSIWALPWQVWKTRGIIRKMNPAVLIDLERTSNGVGLLRLFSKRNALEVSFRMNGPRVFTPSRIEIPLLKTSLNSELSGLFTSLGYPLRQRHLHGNVGVEPKVIVNVNASNYLPQRKYPADRFVDFIRLWAEQHPDTAFYLTGVEEERSYVESIAKQLEGLPVHCVAGQWSLEQLCNEMASAGLVVTNDSGPMHLAHYLGVPTMVIWGPTHPQYVGYGDSDTLINVWSQRSCSPCFEHPKSTVAVQCNGRLDCLKDISADQLLKEARRLWNPGGENRIFHPAPIKSQQPEVKEVQA